jgi:hypothetical protein
MTWTYTNGSTIAVVTADGVEQAKVELAKQGVRMVENVDLIPCVTTTRWCRILQGMRFH